MCFIVLGFSDERVIVHSKFGTTCLFPTRKELFYKTSKQIQHSTSKQPVQNGDTFSFQVIIYYFFINLSPKDLVISLATELCSKLILRSLGSSLSTIAHDTGISLLTSLCLIILFLDTASVFSFLDLLFGLLDSDFLNLFVGDLAHVQEQMYLLHQLFKVFDNALGGQGDDVRDAEMVEDGGDLLVLGVGFGMAGAVQTLRGE